MNEELTDKKNKSLQQKYKNFKGCNIDSLDSQCGSHCFKNEIKNENFNYTRLEVALIKNGIETFGFDPCLISKIYFYPQTARNCKKVKIEIILDIPLSKNFGF